MSLVTVKSAFGKRHESVDTGRILVMLGMTTIPAGTTDHGGLLGLLDDDHTQYMHNDSDRTVQAQHTFSPAAPQAPFVLSSNAQGQTVVGLQADKLDKSVDAGDGLTGGGALTASIELDLDTPGTLTADTTSVAAGNHTHLLTTSYDPGATKSLLRTNVSGHIAFQGLGVGEDPASDRLWIADTFNIELGAASHIRLTDEGRIGIASGPDLRFDSTGGIVEYSDDIIQHTDGVDEARFTLNAGGEHLWSTTGDLVIAPAGKDFLPQTNFDVNLGSITKKFLTLHVAELWVDVLVAQEVISTIGGEILVMPTTELITDWGPATTDFIVLKHNQPGKNDILILNGYERIEFFKFSGLTVADVNTTSDYIQVDGDWTAYFSGGIYFQWRDCTGEPTHNGQWLVSSSSFGAGSTTIYFDAGEKDLISATAGGHIAYTGEMTGEEFYFLNITRDLDGSGANSWLAGDSVVNSGQTGDGHIDLFAVQGLLGTTYGPTILGNVRTSSTYNAWSEHWALGNLNGIYGYSDDTMGLGLGRYDNGYSHLVIDPTNGIRMRYLSSDVNKVVGSWAPGGDVIIGEVKTSSANIFWDQSEGILNIRGGTNGTDVHVYADTDGTVAAADGDLTLSDQGIDIYNIPSTGGPGSGGDPRSLDWHNGTSTIISSMMSHIGKDLGVDKSGELDIYTRAPTYAAGKFAILRLHAYAGGKEAYMGAKADYDDEDDTYGFMGGHDGTVNRTSLLAYGDQVAIGSHLIISDDPWPNNTTNSKQDVGLTIDVALDDSEFLSFWSTGKVAHGVTTETQTQNLGYMRKQEGDEGGLRIVGLTEDVEALLLRGVYTNDDTSKGTGSEAPVEISARKKTGTTTTVPGANANVFAVGIGTATKFIVDEDGDFHYDGADGGAYDEYNDIHLLRAFALSLPGQGIVQSTFDDFLEHGREDLARLGIVTYNDDGHHFVNGARLQKLLAGAMWQMETKYQELLAQFEELKNALTN